MSKIHWSVFLILGTLVSVSSLSNKNLRVFIFLGILFFLWGLIGGIKVLISSRKKSEKATKNQAKTLKLNKRKNSTKQTASHAHPHNHPHNLKKCPNCDAVISKVYRFCPYCGYGV